MTTRKKSSGTRLTDMSQRHVPLVCADNSWLMQHEFLQHFVPATCCTKFNELKSVQHVAGTKLQHSCCLRQKLSVHTREHVTALATCPATFSCVCSYCVFVAAACPRCTSLLHVPQCVRHNILSLLHVAATCPHVCRDFNTGIIPRSFRSFIAGIAKNLVMRKIE